MSADQDVRQIIADTIGKHKSTKMNKSTRVKAKEAHLRQQGQQIQGGVLP